MTKKRCVRHIKIKKEKKRLKLQKKFLLVVSFNIYSFYKKYLNKLFKRSLIQSLNYLFKC